MELIDLRGALPEHSTLRYLARAKPPTAVVVHHTDTAPDTAPEVLARYHVEGKGYPGIAYHYLVYADGRVVWCQDDMTVTWHAGCAALHGDSCPMNANTYTLGIAFVGSFTKAPPTDEHLAVGRELLKMLDTRYGPLGLMGHGEAHGTRTACPGDAFDVEALLVGAQESRRGTLVAARWHAEEAARQIEAILEIVPALVRARALLVEQTIPLLYALEKEALT